MVVANLLAGDPDVSTLGASGAIYGLLLAFGMLFPEQEILVAFIFPMKAKYMVMLFGGIAFVFSFQRGSTVSNLAHLGGMIFGYVYLRSKQMSRFDLAASVKYMYKEWKLQRAKRKFQVYMKKQNHQRDRDRHVN